MTGPASIYVLGTRNLSNLPTLTQKGKKACPTMLDGPGIKGAGGKVALPYEGECTVKSANMHCDPFIDYSKVSIFGKLPKKFILPPANVKVILVNVKVSYLCQPE